MNVVWLKRDLRVEDHAPLAMAAARGDVLVVYVVEDELLACPETDPSHVRFAAQSLEALRDALAQRGAELLVLRGALPHAFAELHAKRRFTALFSHEETGNLVTYDRDKRVLAWCRQEGIPWTEVPQTGVVRRLRTRDGWARRWSARMHAPLVQAPDRIAAVSLAALGLEAGAIPFEDSLGLTRSTKHEAQLGGEVAAQATLASFLAERGHAYASSMSSPVTAWDGCSRLSPYLAFGNLSMRQVVHAAERRRADFARKRSEEARGWRGSLAAFGGRLRWHCHFMQKLEDETRLEFENLAIYMNGLREESFREDRFEAWARGETGFPMVDACMRALLATGWVNFRMRAMLMSFASYDLWLHWRRPGLHLARHFLDFEPGIHWSQVQMQSGSTGINTLRTYSPTKQLRDHDPTGVFVRRWVPELARVPDPYLAEPWKMPPEAQVHAGCILGRDYPRPIVDHNAAIAEARARIMRLRRGADARAEASGIVKKHGSRRGPMRRRTSG
jgi:deoxyribodipyrimidine photo-lyase